MLGRPTPVRALKAGAAEGTSSRASRVVQLDIRLRGRHLVNRVKRWLEGIATAHLLVVSKTKMAFPQIFAVVSTLFTRLLALGQILFSECLLGNRVVVHSIIAILELGASRILNAFLLRLLFGFSLFERVDVFHLSAEVVLHFSRRRRVVKLV